MSEILELDKDSWGYTLDVVAKYDTGDRIDLTGKTPWLIVGNIADGTTHYSGQCSLGTYPKSGECNITVASGMTDTVGVYKAELEIISGTEKIEANRFTLSILPTMAGVSP